MTYDQFADQIRNNSVVKDGDAGYGDPDTGRRVDGKFVLYVVASILDVLGRGSMDRCMLENAILRKELVRHTFTYYEDENKEDNAKEVDADSKIFCTERGFEVCCGKKPFAAYDIVLKVKDEEHHNKLIEALRTAREDYCSDADWLLDPLIKAVTSAK
jgi:hypothetical protein